MGCATSAKNLEGYIRGLDGKEASSGRTWSDGLILLLIDDRASFATRNYTLEGIRFTEDDKFGQWLWKVASPIPSSQQSRWIRWPTYAIFGLHSSLLLYWLAHREHVPITRRQQFQCMRHSTPPPQGGEHTIGVSQGIM